MPEQPAVRLGRVRREPVGVAVARRAEDRRERDRAEVRVLRRDAAPKVALEQREFGAAARDGLEPAAERRIPAPSPPPPGGGGGGRGAGGPPPPPRWRMV